MDKKIKILLDAKPRLEKFLRQLIANQNFNYETFGKEVEEYLIGALIEIFKEEGFIKNSGDYHKAQNKNEFPDLALKSDPKLAIELKAGNQSKKSGCSWETCNNSNNDLGTFNKWPEKLNQFGGEHIYYVFIVYNFNDTSKSITEVQIAPFYQFVGLNSNGGLKYREKDGNLRPRDFFQTPPIKTFEQFMSLFGETAISRSKEIMKKHIKLIPEKDRDEFIESLKKK